MEKPSLSSNVDVETHHSNTHHGGIVPADDSGNGEEPPPDIPNAGSSYKESVQMNSMPLDGARSTKPTPSINPSHGDVNDENIYAYAHTLPVEQVESILKTYVV